MLNQYYKPDINLTCNIFYNIVVMLYIIFISIKNNVITMNLYWKLY